MHISCMAKLGTFNQVVAGMQCGRISNNDAKGAGIYIKTTYEFHSIELLAKLFLKRSVITFDARISVSKWLRFPFLRQFLRFTAFPRP